MTRAVVFAYHDVGVRCLKVLLAHGVDVALVVTHRDNPSETIFFGSVADTARDYGLPVITPDDPNDADTLSRLRDVRPDFLFSFYYRQMLSADVLGTAARGCFNMHGSLLPRYRGRAPVNWAVLHGETETGATLHAMTPKPDDGAIVDQQAVPILPDDTAGDVFGKVTLAAEIVLHRCLDPLVAGTARLRVQDRSQARYFGGRKPADGRIDWHAPAARIHDLVRAVAPPYPGAFTALRGGTLTLLKTLKARPAEARAVEQALAAAAPAGETPAGLAVPAMLVALDGGVSGNSASGNNAPGDALYARCADGAVLRILRAQYDGQPLDAAAFRARFGSIASPDASAGA